MDVSDKDASTFTDHMTNVQLVPGAIIPDTTRMEPQTKPFTTFQFAQDWKLWWSVQITWNLCRLNVCVCLKYWLSTWIWLYECLYAWELECLNVWMSLVPQCLNAPMPECPTPNAPMPECPNACMSRFRSFPGCDLFVLSFFIFSSSTKKTGKKMHFLFQTCLTQKPGKNDWDWLSFTQTMICVSWFCSA